ncbi:MAG: rhamnulokinase family protein [Thermoflexales bacterium]
MTTNYVAMDLGAESGRAVVGAFDGARLALRIVHRFPNRPVRVAGHLHWDALRLFDEIRNGLDLAAREYGEIASVGVDTWGVDYGLLDRTGALIGNPFHYRDHRTDEMMAQVFARIPRQDIFARTGIQFMKLNTLYQLAAAANTPALEAAQRLLMMPDLFNYWLSGEIAGEFTIATTTQFYDPRHRVWATDLLDGLGIPARILPPVIQPATRVGGLLAGHAEHPGLRRTQVIAPACHDTGSAIAAIPARSARFAYISSGTWSLLGAVVAEPVLTEAAYRFDFTNEGGVDGSFRLLKNITGLWLIQECRRAWMREGAELSYDTLVGLAAQARPFLASIDPDDPVFSAPDDMPRAIQDYCAASGQAIPEDRGAIVRVALESLALKYRATLDKLEAILGYRVEAIHVVGGGSQNRMLCQFSADACARPVFAGPVEATAIGNLMAQAIGNGDCASWAQARQIVQATFSPILYEPRETSPWETAYARAAAVFAARAAIS